MDAKSWTGETPLARAALFVRMEIAELLLENGADVNARNVTGMTPLHWAVYLGFQDDDVIELLLEAGADVNAKTKEGQTPVDLAGELGNEEVVELLKKPGAKE